MTVRARVRKARHSFYERTAANNVESRLLHLVGRPGRRTVIATPWHGIEW